MSEPAYKFDYPDLGIEWVEIPAGRFFMGLTKKQETLFKREGKGHILGLDLHIELETPGRELEIKTFYISRFPVTNHQFLEFIQARHPDRYHIREGYTMARQFSNPELSRHPVISKWWDAHEFCAWIGARLPTSMEWEKAARGTDRRLYPWGDQWDIDRGNFGQRNRRGPASIGLSSPVDAYPEGASPYGIYDMMGNGFEWTMTFETFALQKIGSQMLVLRGTTPKDRNLHPWAHRVTNTDLLSSPWEISNYTTFRPVMDETRWKAIYKGGYEAQVML